VWHKIAFSILTGSLLAGLWPWQITGRTRTQPRCGIPKADYQFGSRSQSTMSVSRTGELVFRNRIGTGASVDDPTGRIKKQIKVYQLKLPSLVADHCEISRVAFQVHNNGQWTLSLRADNHAVKQNEENGRFTAHLRRNQFFLKIRCYGSYQVDENSASQSTGKPVLVQLHPPPFWVQREQPYDLHRKGYSEDFKTFYEAIDRVEVEFYYRDSPITTSSQQP